MIEIGMSQEKMGDTCRIDAKQIELTSDQVPSETGVDTDVAVIR